MVMKLTNKPKEKAVKLTITKTELIKVLDKLIKTNIPILINTNRELGEFGNLNDKLPPYIKNRCLMFEVI
jgi:hypothetical protein